LILVLHYLNVFKSHIDNVDSDYSGVKFMQYKDTDGKEYEISYSQKLQKEQNSLARKKNMLLAAILMMMVFFAFGAGYLYLRLEAIDFLSQLMGAIQAIGGTA